MCLWARYKTPERIVSCFG